MTTAKQPRKPAKGLAGHFTRALCNEGTKLYLRDEATGEETEDWILVLGEDADSVREALSVGTRKYAEAAALRAACEEKEDVDKLARAAALEADALADARVAYVAGWSDDSLPLTRENVLQLWKDAPGVGRQIEALGVNRSRFLQLKSINS